MLSPRGFTGAILSKIPRIEHTLYRIGTVKQYLQRQRYTVRFTVNTVTELSSAPTKRSYGVIGDRCVVSPARLFWGT